LSASQTLCTTNKASIKETDKHSTSFMPSLDASLFMKKLNKSEVHSADVKFHVRNVIAKNEMGGACSAYWGGERCVQGFGGET
jgi:hypothetical protein